ncbi:hypothetical protein PLESTB_000362400 [Pleodorina starrii]|uniref:Phytanoyl-CoA dioxygenase n=1 Tax=Pleodorina starrii TaxID=330485 RepID=A0A9W6BDZ3_9CHLO|nr:hypothetical protein PLESTM_000032700 [Pleodorina starrii]GLC50283.1 hypothetical protein PLESTB_000362400 [Pleodorina starrii]GLC64332.1 hypothetical protein PLESTF_000150100 [Pleodorina starrii]
MTANFLNTLSRPPGSLRLCCCPHQNVRLQRGPTSSALAPRLGPSRHLTTVQSWPDNQSSLYSLASRQEPQSQDNLWQDEDFGVGLQEEYAGPRSPPSNRAVVAAAAATRRTKRRWTQLGLETPFAASTVASVLAPPAPAPVSTAALPRSATRARHSAIPPPPKPVTSSTTLSDSMLLRYERDGFVVTRRLLPVDQLTTLRSACEAEVSQRRLESFRHRVRVLCPGVDPASLTSEAEVRDALQNHATDSLGFLQFFNLHRTNRAVCRVALGAELAAVASQLLGARRVRVYQDCVFLKEPGFAETNWHSDLRMAPLDTNDFVTAWIPLRPVRGARGGGPGRSPPDSGLMFAAGSHRDFALPFWHNMEGRDLSDRGYAMKDTGPMEVGDVSWHHGWTLHCAAPQPIGTPPRLALTVAFFADGARLLARRSDPTVRPELLHDEDAESYATWLSALTQGGQGGKGARDGAVARHKLLPVVWPLDASEAANFPL